MVSLEEDMFNYTKKRALIIGISKYDKLREIDRLENADDLPEVMELDMSVSEQGLGRLQFEDDEITKLVEPTYDQMKEAFRTLA